MLDHCTGFIEEMNLVEKHRKTGICNKISEFIKTCMLTTLPSFHLKINT